MLTCLNLGGIVGPNIYGLTGGGDPYAWAGHVVMACIFFTCAMVALGLKAATVQVVESDVGGEAFGRLVVRPSILRLFGCKRTPLTDIGDVSDSRVVRVPVDEKLFEGVLPNKARVALAVHSYSTHAACSTPSSATSDQKLLTTENPCY